MKKFNEAVKVCSLVLLCSLLLSGCFELNPFNSDNNIRFVGTYGMPETKVAYGEVIDNWQQIVWNRGDQIRIVSNHANTLYDGTGNNWADYSVTNVDNNRNNKKSSFANIAVDGKDGLKWETDETTYTFWAAYPSTILNASSKTITAEPEKMPLIAYDNCSYSSDNMVVLHFYPCFTALEFDITTAVGVSGVEITDCRIESVSNQSLTGTFSGSITENGGIANLTVRGGSTSATPSITKDITSGKSFTFFCLPDDINKIKLTCTFTVDGAVHTKSIVLGGDNGSYAACNKHVTSLVLNSTVDGGFELSRGGSQLFGAALMSEGLGGQQTVYELLKDYYNNHSELGIKDQSSFNDSIWNPKVNNLLNNLKDVTYDDLINIFGEEAYNILLNAMRNLEKVRLQQKDISSNISASDLQTLFPNVKELYIQTTDTVSVDVDGLQKLETLELMNVKNATVSSCPKLTSVTIRNSNNLNSISIDNCKLLDNIYVNIAGKLNELSLVNTPKFREGKIENVNQTVKVTLRNCSTEVTSATLYLNGKGNVVERTNSSNVTVN